MMYIKVQSPLLFYKWRKKVPEEARVHAYAMTPPAKTRT